MSSITRLRSGTTARVIYTFGAVAVLRMLDAFIASLYAATFEQTDTRLDRRRLHHIIFYAFG